MTSMTHYMIMMSKWEPWGVILFMAISIIFAETLTITELLVIFNKIEKSRVRTVNKITGILGGFYFSVISIYVFCTIVMPVAQTGTWHGWVDIVAMISYVGGIVFLLPVALMEIKAICRHRTFEQKLKIRFYLLSGYLIVSHLAMIFGMISPKVA